MSASASARRTCACSMRPRSSTACCRPRSAAMTEQKPQRPRRRRWPRVLLALLLIGAIGAVVVHHYTRPKRLTTFLIDEVREQLGAELTLGGDAGYTLVPGLRAELPQPVLKARD